MKKIGLLYDSSIILSGQIDKKNRTGIYFCSYNILRMLRNNTKINIYLYTLNEYKRLISISKKVDVLKGLKFIRAQDEFVYKRNIKNYLNSITNSTNFLLNIICLLKIIKNTLFIVYIKYENRKLKKVNAFFSPCNYIPEMINNYNIKKFVMLYDVIPILFPDYFSGGVPYWINNLKHLDKETYCFCISECTKRDYLKYFGDNLDENKMMVTYISSANEFVPKYDQNAIKYISKKYKLNIDQYKYIFSFCSLEHRKNLIFTVNCFIKFIQKNNINDLYFLLGGVQWDNFVEYFNKTLGELSDNYRSKIIHLGYVDDSDVNMFYSNSLFFIYLSQYEGFGMPPLEAMQAGTPVISAHNSSLPEVVGDAAITIDYDNEEACINAMETFYCNENIRDAYIKKGFERAKLFSWDKTVDTIFNKMKEVISIP